ncbi:MAG: FAD:protein FMN transferase [Eubacteriales bacterium]
MKPVKMTGLLLLLCLLLTQAGCAARPQMQTSVLVVFAMDTSMTLTIYEKDAEGLLSDCEQLIIQMNRLLNAHAQRSETYALSQSNGEPVVLSAAFAEVLAQALYASELTGGAFDLTIYPLVSLWGFPSDEYRVPTAAELAAALPLVDYTQLQFNEAECTAVLPPGMRVDLGGIAKGYTGDLLYDTLQAAGVAALLDLGGGIVLVGQKPDKTPWRIAVRDPLNTSKHVGVLSLEEGFVQTSGAYERYFEGEDGVVYHHILDPKTGYPSEGDLASVTVIGRQGALCDALSTAFFVLGLEESVRLWRTLEGFELVLVTKNGDVYITEGIRDRFTPTDNYTDTNVSVLTRSVP